MLYTPLAIGLVLIGGARVGGAELVFIAGSAVLHVAYFLLLGQGYRIGDLSLVYPLARGTGPLLATGAAIAWLGERPAAIALVGAALIGAGVLVLTGDPRAFRRSGAGSLIIRSGDSTIRPGGVMRPYAAIRERLDRGETVVLDGGIGSELVRRGIRWRGHGMRTDADAVRALHEEYLAAGADVIRTNTFQLNRRTYLNVFRNPEHLRHIGAPGLEQRAPELLRRAVALAQTARERSGREGVAIAGVMSPLEHCFRPDLAPPPAEAQAEHREIAELLAEAGADLLLLESMNTIGEAQIAAEAARATGLPVWVSFVASADGNVLSGEPLAEAVRAVGEVEAVLVNGAPPEDIARAIAILAGRSGRPFGAYAHVGKFDPPSWKFEFFPQFSQTESWPPERYAVAARGWWEHGARLIGGCCGTGPAHTRALKAALAEAR